MTLGDKIYHYEVKIDFVKQTVNQTKRDHTLIGLNKDYGVFDDYSFTKARLTKKGGYKSDVVFDEPRAYEFKIYSYNEVTGYIYSTIENDKKMYSKIKKQLEKFIDEKYGCYCNGRNLTSQIVC